MKQKVIYAIYATYSDGERPPLLCKKITNVTRYVRLFLTNPCSEIPNLRICRVVVK
jgi:hypothetical protein